MAYAQLAGLDPVAGLWAALLPLVAYAALTTPWVVWMGPESTTAITAAAAIGPLAGGEAAGMRNGHLRGALSPQTTQRQMDVLAAYVSAGVL